MIVKELFKSLNKNVFIRFYLNYSEEKRTNKEKVSMFFDSLLEIEPKENDDIIFVIPSFGTQLNDSFIIPKENLHDYQAGHYAYEGSPLEEILGAKVSNACLHYIKDKEVIAATIFYELSFYGYSLDKREERISGMMSDINNAIKEIESGKGKLIPANEVFKNLEEKYGIKDERTKAEKLFDNKEAQLTMKFTKEIISELCKLELTYENL